MTTSEWAPEWFPLPIALIQHEPAKLYSLAAQGAFIQILILQFQRGSVPSDVKQLSRLIGCDSEDLLAVWSEFQEVFEIGEDGRMSHDVVTRIRDEQQQRAAAAKSRGAKGAASRWGESPQGSEAAPKPKTPPAPDVGGFDPLSSPAEQHSMLLAALPASHQTGEMRQALEGWLKVRKQKRWDPLIPDQAEELIKPLCAQKTPVAVEMVNQAIRCGYREFFAPKTHDSADASGGKNGHARPNEPQRAGPELTEDQRRGVRTVTIAQLKAEYEAENS